MFLQTKYKIIPIVVKLWGYAYAHTLVWLPCGLFVEWSQQGRLKVIESCQFLPWDFMICTKSCSYHTRRQHGLWSVFRATWVCAHNEICMEDLRHVCTCGLYLLIALLNVHAYWSSIHFHCTSLLFKDMWKQIIHWKNIHSVPVNELPTVFFFFYNSNGL